jgi:C1A family cysteine protease
LNNKYIPKRAYTLRPDLPVPNEKLITNVPATGGLPPELLLKGFPPTVWNQGDTNSCTAQSLCALYYFFNKVDSSRLFQYYNERLLMNIVNQDVGVSLRDAVTALFNYGICEESLWPFDISKLTTKPTDECYTNASIGNILSAAKFDTQNPSFITQVKNALSLNLGVVIGIAVYPGMESEAADMTGIVPMPNVSTESPIGGHAIPLTGYSDMYQAFFFRNSWGADWGQKGNGLIPYEYLKNYCISAWIISDKEVGYY